jgi:2-C-methyl-D-erythritol 4-phosphate cytidylyltransferase
VQTPQTFRIEVIRRALGEVQRRGVPVTDDTAACQWIDQSVRLVECAEPNPKVTTPADLPAIELRLRAMLVS